ncbi:MAG: putative lipid II flippase FtsW [Christensenellaceae bacterium]|jgi:cell division protein FtsW|nr:putative lipid II flippase FtsW [Christensenellaceae bacterium]
MNRLTGAVTITLTIILLLLGLVFVYSASSYSAQVYYGNEYYFLFKQIIGVLLGVVALIIMSFLDYNKLKRFKWWFAGLGFVLLAIVFIPGVGIENYGAKRWIGIGSFTIQSSEIAKFCFVIFAAIHLSQHYDKVKTFKGILPVVLVGSLFCALILLEPNMSVTICCGVVLVSMLFVGGIKFKHMAFLLIPALVLVPLLIIIEPYRLDRLMAFINPWASPQGEGYQLIQSLFSIGSGGLFGVGLFASRQKYLFLPFAESDFIFSIITEEIGIVGAGFVLLLFLALIICGIKIAKSAKDRFGSYLAAGITSLIAIQVLVNVAVVTGAIPPTGLPLPFISAGSSSIIVLMAAVGVLVNIHRSGVKAK